MTSNLAGTKGVGRLPAHLLFGALRSVGFDLSNTTRLLLASAKQMAEGAAAPSRVSQKHIGADMTETMGLEANFRARLASFSKPQVEYGGGECRGSRKGGCAA
jgi:hypothetical protein